MSYSYRDLSDEAIHGLKCALGLADWSCYVAWARYITVVLKCNGFSEQYVIEKHCTIKEKNYKLTKRGGGRMVYYWTQNR